MKTIHKLCVLVLAIACTCLHACFGQGTELLWKGVGGKQQWEQTTYLLFTGSGNSIPYLQNNRSFLIHRTSGQARFEGQNNTGNTLVVLFNYQSGELQKFYVNDTQVKSTTEIVESFQKILEQFYRDKELLFLPTQVESLQTTGKISSRIINAEKLLALPIQLPHNHLSGELLFHPETGQIKHITEGKEEIYLVSGYKDIGGGIYLPTIFKHVHNDSKSVQFSTVAAFTDMQENKFTEL